MSSPQAPKILSLHTNVSTLTEGNDLVISAVVTDPDGIDDLIGGNLTTADGNSAYGVFSTAAAEGAYSISLSWGIINTTSEITVGLGATAPRQFRAVFFDAEGHSTVQQLSVGLTCGPHAATCGSHCWALNTPDHCGSCEPCPYQTDQCEPVGGSYACVSLL